MHTSRAGVLVGFFSLALACAPAAAPAGLTDADRAAIQEIEDQWVQRTNSKEWEAAANGLFAPDGIMLPPNSLALNGPAAVAGWLASFPPFSDLALERVSIDGRGDIAYVHGRYSFVMTPSGAPPVRDEGKYLVVYRKQAEGAWKATLDMFNSDLPVAAPPAPPTAQ